MQEKSQMISHSDGFEDHYTGACDICGERVGIRSLVGFPIRIPLICQCEKDRLKKERQDEERRENEERIRKIRDQFMDTLNLMYRNATFDSFIIRAGTENALKVSKRFCSTWDERKKDGKGLLFIGNTGSGKTHLSVAIGHEISKSGERVRFVDVNTLIRKIRDCPFGETEETLSPYMNCALFILDDFGSESDTDWAAAQIGAIVNYRTENYKPMILTSNLLKEELDKRKGQRVVDRVLGSCSLIPVICPSYRRGGANG
jgi:DNA replication protein DnaC